MSDNPSPNAEELSADDPRVKALIEQATKGLRDNRDQVLLEKRQEREARQKVEGEVSDLKAALDRVGGIDGLTKLSKEQRSADLLKRLADDPDGFEDLIAKERVEREVKKREAIEVERDTLKAEVDAERAANASLLIRSYVSKHIDMVADDVREDAIDRLEKEFELDDDRKPVISNGLSMDDLVDRFLESRPSFKKKSSGGGALGGSNRKRGGTRADFLKQSTAAQWEMAEKDNPTKG